MVLKSYFDGGNQEDSSQYDRITLATVSGSGEQWRSFNEEWSKTLDLHEAQFLHTTDAVSLNNDFSIDNGWDDTAVDALILDCVRVAEKHLQREFERGGLCAVTLSIQFADYSRAIKANPKLPNTAAEICATESLSFAFKWGKFIGANWYELYFDQGEPFYGHVHDRRHNKGSKKAIPLMKQVIHLGESNMRVVPALQLADLFAWCSNHDAATRKWHLCLNDLPWYGLYLGYDHLLNPRKGVLELMESWKLPPRRKRY